MGLAQFINKIHTNRHKGKVDVQEKSNLGNSNISAAWELDEGGSELPVAIHPTNVHTRMNTQKSCFTVQGKM